jgi:nitrite reductase/ring-hydroxylating ferredoxin subunit
MSVISLAPHSVFAGSVEHLERGDVLTVSLARDEFGRPREAIVLLDANRIPRAYLNLCRHLPIPLDAASRTFLRDGLLECATHGARYRIEDGLCVAGPCRGTSLYALEVHIENSNVFVIEPAPEAERRLKVLPEENN